MSDDELLKEAVDATLARMAALRDADEQLGRRRKARRQLHYQQGVGKAEVARRLLKALQDQGLTDEQLRDAGVYQDSVMRVLRTSE